MKRLLAVLFLMQIVTVAGSTSVLAAASDDTGFIPPDKATARCERAVANGTGNLAICVMKCHYKQADAAAANLPFDDDACEAACKSKLVLLKRCAVPCLTSDGLASFATTVESFFDANNDQIYCAGTSPFGGDDTGFVPPDKITARCEKLAAKGTGKLADCVVTCHIRQADAAMNGTPYSEETCEAACATRVYLPKACAASCANTANLASFATTVDDFFDSNNDQIYCAGTKPLP